MRQKTSRRPMSHHVARRTEAPLVGILVAVPTVAVLAAFSRAHTELEDSTPKHRATTARAPAEVKLDFTDMVQDAGARVTVRGPEGKQFGRGKPEVSGDTVTQRLRPLNQPGRYQIAFRIIARDGHPVSDTITFTFAPSRISSDAAPNIPRSPVAADPHAGHHGQPGHEAHHTGQEKDTGNSETLVYAAGGIALLAILGGGGAAYTRSRSGRGD